MTLDELFDALDLGSDGELSRTELHEAAREMVDARVEVVERVEWR